MAKQRRRLGIAGGLPKAMLVLIVLLAGCSALTPMGLAKSLISPASDGLSVELDTTIGDKQENVQTQIGSTNHQQASTIQNIEEANLLLIIIAIIGWMLPSPAEIWRGFLGLFKLRRVR